MILSLPYTIHTTPDVGRHWYYTNNTNKYPIFLSILNFCAFILYLKRITRGPNSKGFAIFL